MARVKHHVIERLVINYLKNLTGRKLRTERTFMDKAIKMIASKLESPCCDGNPAFTYNTWKKSTFLFTLRSLLLKVDANKWVESLTRAKELLERVYNQECCFFQIQGFGGAEEDLCIGGTTPFFISAEVIAIGVTLYQNQQLTPVSFTLFRDDATGIIYNIVDGVITSVAEISCSQIFQICNLDVTPGVFISDVDVDTEDLIFLSGTDFPIGVGDCGQFNTSNSAPGNKTVRVTITGTSPTATLLDIIDSNGVPHNLPFIGPGVYTFEDVFVSGPNIITTGPGITLT